MTEKSEVTHIANNTPFICHLLSPRQCSRLGILTTLSWPLAAIGYLSPGDEAEEVGEDMRVTR